MHVLTPAAVAAMLMTLKMIVLTRMPRFASAMTAESSVRMAQTKPMIYQPLPGKSPLPAACSVWKPETDVLPIVSPKISTLNFKNGMK